MALEMMLRMGQVLQNAPLGSSVTVDHTGVHVQLPRYFYPNLSTAWTGPTTPATLIRYNPTTQVSNTLFSTLYAPTKLVPMRTKVAIFVDGACRNNGNPGAQAAYGVFFGNGSKHNTHGLVENSHKQTSQVAEVVAALKALEILKEVSNYMGTTCVVIVSDSEYLVKSMCEYVWKWVENGFKASTGKQVENEGLLKELHERIEELGEEGLEVKFWHVKGDMNQDADRLANMALDSLLHKDHDQSGSGTGFLLLLWIGLGIMGLYASIWQFWLS